MRTKYNHLMNIYNISLETSETNLFSIIEMHLYIHMSYDQIPKSAISGIGMIFYQLEDSPSQ